ncbi:CinA family protein [Desulfolutivibrio sulfoxidireducens]|uniref:CinA family protein n=1 Tax=Desulfolutivibrio sulfoxidireducens TaxID=2773299 RepID=UPI00159D396F|nr:CinA family protein [Desulfolutivibrio sulfoxidireducens]QLA17748.1 nicotinamide-nucleotide amidohydrolase family protein [Desulfolutivibrio sulfoxidireducens]QLA21324.1 nicotinamide-nucleotide amidohydrolase family protein [Desulfolutivibrio sulfoxidireducens]
MNTAAAILSAAQAVVPRLAKALSDRNLSLATAESCTGGLIGHLLTNQPGSSRWFLGGVVAYADSAKAGLLGVPPKTLSARGAVSEETVLAMAEGARRTLGAACAVAVSGIAGPDGGTPEKPVGTVWMAFATPEETTAQSFLFTGEREEIKAKTAAAALGNLLARLAEADE